MKTILICSVAAMSFLLRGAAADYPVVYDGWDHGDPPFLLEDGWTPLLNVHENKERLGRTTASPDMPEATTNPVVMLQGDHGAVAFRNIYVRPLRPLPQF